MPVVKWETPLGTPWPDWSKDSLPELRRNPQEVVRLLAAWRDFAIELLHFQINGESCADEAEQTETAKSIFAWERATGLIELWCDAELRSIDPAPLRRVVRNAPSRLDDPCWLEALDIWNRLLAFAQSRIVQNGPGEKPLFNWNGQTHELTNRQWDFVNFCWGRGEVEFLEIAENVFDDPMTNTGTIKSALSRLKTDAREKGIGVLTRWKESSEKIICPVA